MNTRALPGTLRVSATILFVLLGTCTTLTAHAAFVPQRDHGLVFDSRYNHNQYYPRRGVALASVPAGHVFGSVPYYYADSTYYLWRAQTQQYVVTNPPDAAASGTTAPPASTEPFVYPKNGQSEQKIADDRYECHAWAANQSGFDPTRQLGGVSTSLVAGKGADYYRAQASCLEARRYSVK